MLRGRNGVVVVIGAVVTAALCAPVSAREAAAPPRALSLGDAVYALGMGTSGLYFNPAAMSQMAQYAIEAGYGYTSSGELHAVQSSVVDSQTNENFGGGFGYAFIRSQKSGDVYNAHQFRAALSGSVSASSVKIAFGAGFRYLKISGSRSVSAPTMDVGVLLGVSDRFWIGASGQNLIPVSKQFCPRMLGVGAGLVLSPVNIGGGAVIDFDSLGKTVASPNVGIEAIIASMIALRAGFFWDRVPGAYRVSGGLGYVSKWVGVDVGYAHDAARKDGFLISASVRVFLP